jgi:hypothetical protein
MAIKILFYTFLKHFPLRLLVHEDGLERLLGTVGLEAGRGCHHNFLVEETRIAVWLRGGGRGCRRRRVAAAIQTGTSTTRGGRALARRRRVEIAGGGVLRLPAPYPLLLPGFVDQLADGRLARPFFGEGEFIIFFSDYKILFWCIQIFFFHIFIFLCFSVKLSINILHKKHKYF